MIMLGECMSRIASGIVLVTTVSSNVQGIGLNRRVTGDDECSKGVPWDTEGPAAVGGRYIWPGYV